MECETENENRQRPQIPEALHVSSGRELQQDTITHNAISVERHPRMNSAMEGWGILRLCRSEGSKQV